MELVRSVGELQRRMQRLRRLGKRIGFVPTMGALHQGHLSLLEAARKQNDEVVLSIFVNPLQFGPHDDFARYPRVLRQDRALAKAAGTDLVFAPSREQLYPEGFSTTVEVHGLSETLEGVCRPGHFRGVTTVVTKLVNLVSPDVTYMGQKDYQQALLVKRLVEDLHLPGVVKVMPTLREPDGLAMSSRNRYFNPQQRQKAVVVWRSLQAAKAAIREGVRDAATIKQRMRRVLTATPGVRIDYVAVTEAQTLKPVARLTGKTAVLVAAWVDQVRCIDNVLLHVK